jgi:hypothetical protein
MMPQPTQTAVPERNAGTNTNTNAAHDRFEVRSLSCAGDDTTLGRRRALPRQRLLHTLGQALDNVTLATTSPVSETLAEVLKAFDMQAGVGNEAFVKASTEGIVQLKFGEVFETGRSQLRLQLDIRLVGPQVDMDIGLDLCFLDIVFFLDIIAGRDGFIIIMGWDDF